MKKFYLLFIVFALISCKSPKELLENGDYDSAFDRAVEEVKREKNVEENRKVIKRAAKLKVDEALIYAYAMTKSGKVSDWINTQSKVFVLLEDLGKANVSLNGLISDSYDSLCDKKKEIDFQIVEYYHEAGQDHLDRFYIHENKIDARNAYKSFKECEKYEGDSFFPGLADNMEDAYQNGIVYYVSNLKIGSRPFLKPLPKDAHIKPDCDIQVSHGFVSYSTREQSTTENQSKEIQKGTEAITDTSGHTTFKPILETVTATITTKTITLTASVDTYLKSKNISGQCSVQSTSFRTQVSDSYEEVSVSGDKRALIHHVFEQSGEPAFFRSKLENKLLEQANRRIGI